MLQLVGLLIANLATGKENTLIVPNGALGGPFKTDSNGTIYLLFTIPAETFRTGDRTFILVNVDNIKSTDAIITSAEAIYSASNISFSRSEKTFNVKNPEFVPFTWNEYFTTSWTQVIPPRRRDPVGQTFSINGTADVKVPGVYLTEIGVFFKKKNDTLGATLKVCQTVAGVPDAGKIVCSAYLNSSDITVSDDASAETRFKFEFPGLLQSDETYFFFVEPDGSNPDYEIWISEVGGVDISTSRAITQQPYPGIMYVSSDGASWSPVQSTDIKFNLYRAKFKYNSATITFRNDTDDYLTTNVISRKTSGVAPQVGDVVYATNATNGSALISTQSVTYPYGIIQFIDELNNTIYLDQSNGRFNSTFYANVNIYRVTDRANTQLIIESNRVANATISSINNPIYHGIVPRFSIMEPSGTYSTLSFKGTSNSTTSFVKDGGATGLVNGTLYEFLDYERVVRSYSNEVAAGSYGNDGTCTFTVTIGTQNQYVSPVIDLGTKTFNIIQNVINANTANEFTRYGSAQSKYISKTVFLNQEAEDLLVYVGAHRPPGTDVLVYGKFENSNIDPAQFDEKDWSLLSYRNDTGLVYTSKDPGDFREYVFGLPIANTFTRGLPNTTLGILSANAAYSDLDAAANTSSISPNGILTYFDGARRIYRGFNNFSLKIVLVSNDPVVIPTVKDVRAIALQI
jgi:hypothetical protein